MVPSIMANSPGPELAKQKTILPKKWFKKPTILGGKHICIPWLHL